MGADRLGLWTTLDGQKRHRDLHPILAPDVARKPMGNASLSHFGAQHSVLCILRYGNSALKFLSRRAVWGAAELEIQTLIHIMN